MESSSPATPRQSPSAIGAYRIDRLLGTGGSASVYRAVTPDGAVVAVKLLDAALSAAPAERNRFLRGFKVASILFHSGIARLLEAGEHDGRLFVVEEYVDGETLAERLRGGRLPVDEALRILKKTGEVLAYAHQAGVVHRDLSSRNLMLERSGRVVLVDFGIAIRPDGTTQGTTNSLLGTLSYLAPELIRGHPANARSDLYALGIIGYEMLAGFAPFAATKPEAVIEAHLRRRPARLRSIRPEVDPRVDGLILRLLAKRPEDRFGNATGFLQALDNAVLARPARSNRRIRVPATSRTRRVLAVRRLAVGPFTTDFDPEGDDERSTQVALGLAETVAAALAGIDRLTIIPPTQVARAPGITVAERIQYLRVDAYLQAHLARSDEAQRVTWSLVGHDGGLLEGGRIGGLTRALFELEDALVTSIVTAIGRPGREGSLKAAGDRGDWYPAFLEALGCLQRTDSPASVTRAITLLEGVRDAGAGGVQVHAALGRAYLRHAEVTHEPEWRKRAETSCRIAIGLDPLAPEALLTMGRLFVLSGRAAEAKEKLEHALALQPNHADALLWLSRALESTGDFDAATRAAERARRIRPDYWLTHDRLATLNFRRGRFLPALRGWRRVLELTPDNAHALTNLGTTLFKRGSLDAAESAFRAGIEVQPQARAFDGLGLVCFHRGDFDEAAHWFRAAVDRAPAHWRYHGDLAEALRWVPGAQEESHAAFDRAMARLEAELRTNPEDGASWAQLALYRAKREQHVEARTAFTRALALSPDSVIVRSCGVIVHELSGHRPDAIRILDELARGDAISVELRCDPELGSLRESPEARPWFTSGARRRVTSQARKGAPDAEGRQENHARPARGQ